MQNAITMQAPGHLQTDEEKTYLVLYTGMEEDGSIYKDYEYITGSDNVIISIMEKIDTIDIFKSEIILQDRAITLFDRLSLLDFIKHRIAKSNDLVRLGYSDFDLNNYIENTLLLEDMTKSNDDVEYHN